MSESKNGSESKIGPAHQEEVRCFLLFFCRYFAINIYYWVLYGKMRTPFKRQPLFSRGGHGWAFDPLPLISLCLHRESADSVLLDLLYQHVSTFEYPVMFLESFETFWTSRFLVMFSECSLKSPVDPHQD